MDFTGYPVIEDLCFDNYPDVALLGS